MKKEYTNGEITVTWEPDRCIHSTFCWKQLGSVFKPNTRPWVNTEGAPSEEIMEQVKKCPSGALGYYWNEKKEEASEPEARITIEVMKDGPLIIHGNLSVTLSSGEQETKNTRTAFCRCGSSQNKPYCDGTHKTKPFRD